LDGLECIFFGLKTIPEVLNDVDQVFDVIHGFMIDIIHVGKINVIHFIFKIFIECGIGQVFQGVPIE
jgi:hypothetical protein